MEMLLHAGRYLNTVLGNALSLAQGIMLIPLYCVLQGPVFENAT
jgi:hypothetical protein